MHLSSLFLIALGLSMDAFAISVCKGLAMKKAPLPEACIVGLWFGAFQAIMPCIGYLLGNHFEKYIIAIDHWIVFAMLSMIGLSMIWEALSPDGKDANASLSPKTMFLLATATSIDALAVGITFAFLQVSILPAICLIGSTTFLFSAIGVKIGHSFGLRCKRHAEIIGGVLLILMGVKILLEHLGLC